MFLFIWIFCAVLALALLAAGYYLLGTPWPAVRLLRKKLTGQLKYPPDYSNRLERVRISRDIVYPSRYGRNTVDLYTPRGKELVSLILWVHGGSFVAGCKSGVENWAAMLASDGYAVAAMDYEWAPEAHYPAQIGQINECLRKLSELSAREHIDIGRVFLAGDSAGAHMAAQFAALWTNGALARELGICACLPRSALRGALLYCGPYDVESMTAPENRLLRFFMGRVGWSYFGHRGWRKSALLRTTTLARYAASDFPPCYITDGNIHSFELQGRAFAQALREKGVTVRERFFPKEAGDVDHEYQCDLTAPEGLAAFADTLDFLSDFGQVRAQGPDV